MKTAVIRNPWPVIRVRHSHESRVTDSGLRSPRHRSLKLSSAFTLIELLVALVILAMAFTVIWRTFAATMDGWNRGNKFLETLHHGDFVIEQLVSALRSAAYYQTKPGAYGFWLESRGGASPRDEISWVTSSSAFMSPKSPMMNQLHRIRISIDDAPDGREGFTVEAWAPLADPEEIDPEKWTITSKIKGISCETYNFENETWDNEWEDTNTVPSLIRVTLFLDPVEKYGEPVRISRLVEIPIAAATNAAPINTDAPAGGAPAAPQPGQPPVQQPIQQPVQQQPIQPQPLQMRPQPAGGP
jgi:prepilin-type N-terminal cleavage/methylation domain-containing protein